MASAVTYASLMIVVNGLCLLVSEAWDKGNEIF